MNSDGQLLFHGKSILIYDMQVMTWPSFTNLVLGLSCEGKKYNILFRNVSGIHLHDLSFPVQICGLEAIDNTTAGFDRNSLYLVQDLKEQKIYFYCADWLVVTQELFAAAIEDILINAEQEIKLIQDGGNSPWNIGFLEDAVIPEMNELLTKVRKGLVFHNNGKTRLPIMWHLTDSFEPIIFTPLGRKICRLDDMYPAL